MVVQNVSTPPSAANRQLHMTNFMREEAANTVWRYAASVGETIHSVTEPAFYAPAAAQMKPGDEVKVMAKDGSFYVRLLVRVVEPKTVLVHVMEAVNFEEKLGTKDELDFAPYNIVFKGPQSKWTVTRIADKAVLHEGGRDRIEAEAWLRGHLLKLAA